MKDPKKNRLEILTESQLKPDRSNLIGDGLYIYHCFYYDLDCRVFVGLDDIAVENLNLFYYLT